MPSRLRLPILILLLIAGNLAVWHWGGAHKEIGCVPLDDFPFTLGDWIGFEMSPAENAPLTEADFQDNIYRRYYRGTDQMDLRMFVRDVRSHIQLPPVEACLPSHGYKVLDWQRREINCDGRKMPIIYMLIQWKNEKQVCVYWYASQRDNTRSRLLHSWLMARDSFIHPDTHWALIRVIAPVKTREEDTYQAVADFVRQIAPLIPRI